MTEEELDKTFQEAVETASTTHLRFPPDIKLYFYAYYKRATGNNIEHSIEMPNKLISAFKMNALFQTQNISENQAKEKYIELVEYYINQAKK